MAITHRKRQRGIVRAMMRSVVTHCDRLLNRNSKMFSATGNYMLQPLTATAVTNCRNRLSLELAETGPYLPFPDPD